MRAVANAGPLVARFASSLVAAASYAGARRAQPPPRMPYWSTLRQYPAPPPDTPAATPPARPSPAMPATSGRLTLPGLVQWPLTLAVINNKGGVGKTTTAVNLAAALATWYRVLLIDLDSQASASHWLSAADADVPHSLVDVLCGEASLRRIIRPSAVAGLDVVPNKTDLNDDLSRLTYQRDRYTRLSHALRQLGSDYQFIVLDCPPSLSVVARNALAAADGLVVPVVPHYLALEGLNTLFMVVERMRLNGLPAAALWGIALTIVDNRNRTVREVGSAIRRHYGQAVLHTEIPVNIRLAEASLQGTSIFDHAARSAGARDYWKLTKELLERLKDPVFRRQGSGGGTAWRPLAQQMVRSG